MDKQSTQLPTPTMMLTGEIRFEDGTSMLVPQPSRDIWFRMDDAYVLNLPVQPTVPEQPDSNAPHRTYSLWAYVCLWLGALLSVGAGAFFVALGLIR
jgi:hypothetical protein